MAVIVLSVNGGIVECVSNPTDVEVVLHDYDIEGMGYSGPDIKHDDYGDYMVIHLPPEG